MALTTLDKVQDEVKGTQANQTPAIAQQVLGYIRTVSQRVNGYGFAFEPYYEAKPFTPFAQNVNTALGTLDLNDNLLEPLTITIGGAAATYGSDVLPYPNNGLTPISKLRLAKRNSSAFQSWYPCCATPDGWLESIVVSGFWGMRQWYGSQGFFDSGVTCPALTATQATMVVSDVAGPDVYGRTPLFSPGNLLRIDNELMEVAAVATSTKTLTLLRGMNGSAAATHSAGTPIRVWEPEPDVVNMVTRQAALLYARRGSYYNMATYPDGAQVSYPSDLLAEVRATIARYSYVVS